MALANLVLVIMVEAGKVPLKSAQRVADALFQAATGKKIEDTNT